jgi:hypothetical protein
MLTNLLKFPKAVKVRLCQIMWVHVEVRCGGGLRWEQGIPRCTQIHTSLIVNQAYACATTNSTGLERHGEWWPVVAGGGP